MTKMLFSPLLSSSYPLPVLLCLCLWVGGLGLSGQGVGGFFPPLSVFFSSSFSFAWFFMCLNTFVVLPLYFTPFLQLIQIAVVSFSAWKYNHKALFFLSGIPWLRLCSLCFWLSPLPCLRGTAEWRDGTTSNHKRGEEEQSVLLRSVRSSTWKQRRLTCHLNKTTGLHTWEKLKLKYRFHYTGIVQYQYQRWYRYYRYLDQSAHP